VLGIYLGYNFNLDAIWQLEATNVLGLALLFTTSLVSSNYHLNMFSRLKGMRNRDRTRDIVAEDGPPLC